VVASAVARVALRAAADLGDRRASAALSATAIRVLVAAAIRVVSAAASAARPAAAAETKRVERPVVPSTAIARVVRRVGRLIAIVDRRSARQIVTRHVDLVLSASRVSGASAVIA
jgi:hypothetical protein